MDCGGKRSATPLWLVQAKLAPSEIARDGRRSDEIQELDSEVFFGVGLGFLRRAAVHDETHDFFPDDFLVAEDLDRVAVALAHLLSVGARDGRDLFADARLRQHEG